ncbi:MAG: OmpA family protein [Gammaproteobacteria bacterium]
MQIDRSDRSGEDVLLELESVAERVATAAGLKPVPVVGDAPAVAALIDGTEALRTRAETAEKALAGRERQVQSLEDELREMDQKLGGAATERQQLVMTLESRQRAGEQFARLQSMFAPDEGVVLRQNNNVVLRLTGLSFGTGSAQLQKRSQPLLKKVSDALSLYPGATIVVEGHTDASGSAEANLRLSTERARAVANRIAADVAVPGQPISSRGYGEDQPIASNDTAAGRARNRRIDIIIQTNDVDPGN